MTTAELHANPRDDAVSCLCVMRVRRARLVMCPAHAGSCPGWWQQELKRGPVEVALTIAAAPEITRAVLGRMESSPAPDTSR